MAKQAKPKVNPFTADVEARTSKSCPAVVMVTWKDACIANHTVLDLNPGWTENWESGAYMRTVGYLLQKTDHWVTIAMEGHGEGDTGYRRIQDIPVYSIAKLEELRPAVSTETKGWRKS